MTNGIFGNPERSGMGREGTLLSKKISKKKKGVWHIKKEERGLSPFRERKE
jgi:hypothetical protein